MKRFKLRIAKTDYWVWVLIYDSVAEMRAAGAKHDRDRGIVQMQAGGGAGDEFHSRALGITHRYTGRRFDAAGNETAIKQIGIIRLAKGHLSPEIVSHEVIHAALWGYRLKFNHANMGRMWGPLWREEFYAHMFSGTFAIMNRLLHKKGFWR